MSANLKPEIRIAVSISAVLALVFPLQVGCSQSLEPVFEDRDSPIAWPPPPAPARIRYLGQLRTSADLKPARKPLQTLGEWLLGPEPPPRLYGPRSAVCTPDGRRLWVADPGGRCVHMFDLQDRSYRKVTTLGDAHLLSPVGLCLGSPGSFYLCDSENVAIYRLSTLSGTLLESLRLPVEVQRPIAASYDPNAGELFVVDVSAHNIKVLGKDGRLRRIIGRRGVGPGEFNFPCDITDDGEFIWIADAGNHRIQALTRSGRPVTAIGQAGDAPGDLAMPKGIATDSDGHVYVVDTRFENVQIFDKARNLLLFFGGEGIGPGEFWLPSGIFIDANDRVWICDSYNARIQVFNYLKPPETPLADDAEDQGDSASPAMDPASKHARADEHSEVLP